MFPVIYPFLSLRLFFSKPSPLKVMLITKEIHLFAIFQILCLSMKKPQVLSVKQLGVVSQYQTFHRLVFFISSFTVFVTPSINRPESSSDFAVLIIPSISPFAIIKPKTIFLLLQLLQSKFFQLLIQAKHLQTKEQQGPIILFLPNLPIELPKILLYISKIYLKFYVFSPN